MQALEHLRVLDLTRILAGPWATQILADMGADVIKVERPGDGDDTRAWGPPFLVDAHGVESDTSSYFLSTNRGKRSITVDLATARGQQLVRELAMKADVVLENYKVGSLAKYGLSYEDLSAEHPELIYCSITGFGQTGPYALLPGYDFVFQGMSGLMSITGQPEGTPGDEPMKVGIAMSDIITGMYAATAVLGALEARHVTGKGQHIDLALLDCATAISSYQAINFQLSGEIPKRLGNAHSNMVPYQVFQCSVGNVIVAVGNDRQFASYCEVIGLPELANDERYATVAQRNRNRANLIPILAEAMLTREMADWVKLFEAANVPCGPINDLKQVFEDPQIQHRRMLLSLPHSLGVDAPTVASPIRFSETPIVHRKSAPQLGEHTHEILADVLGRGEDEIAQLRIEGAV